MFGSGAKIGWMWTITDHARMVWLIRQVHLKRSTVCCAVEGGTATSTTVALRNAAATRPTSWSLLAMACASRGLRKDEAAAFAACEEAIYSFMLRQMQRLLHFHEASWVLQYLSRSYERYTYQENHSCLHCGGGVLHHLNSFIIWSISDFTLCIFVRTTIQIKATYFLRNADRPITHKRSHSRQKFKHETIVSWLVSHLEG